MASINRRRLDSAVLEEEDFEPDVCVHGKCFDVICVECCPEDDDGSFTGDEWSEG